MSLRSILRGDGALFRHASGCVRRWERVADRRSTRGGRGHTTELGAGPARRGPVPRQSDAQLLAAIRAASRAVPVSVRRRPSQGPRTDFGSNMGSASPARGCCALMRAHGLLSPRACVRAPRMYDHDGRVISPVAPNVMWGTDGVAEDSRRTNGWGWIFAAVEHWNAECVGWHVCKVGSRFAALDPIARARRLYGSLDADVARGLALRMDHGSQYLIRPSRPQADPVLALIHREPAAAFSQDSGNERESVRAVESYAQAASDPRPNLS